MSAFCQRCRSYWRHATVAGRRPAARGGPRRQQLGRLQGPTTAGCGDDGVHLGGRGTARRLKDASSLTVADGEGEDRD